jgi:pyruvate,orthophosphate dikinase
MEILFTDMKDEGAIAVAGSKGENLLRLGRLGLRVPPAFILGTAACRTALDTRGGLTTEARDALRDGIARLERATRRTFGGSLPLLVSVRSSPPVSMPGMLSTVLNVGMTPAVERRLLQTTGNPSFVWDTSRRFVESYVQTVSGCSPQPFSLLRDEALASAGCSSLDELDPLALRDLAHESHRLAAAASSTLPDDAFAQLEAAVAAVITSWDSPRASAYRRMSHLDDSSGTAVVVQAMVFGNWNVASGAGVAFTRNPSTGDPRLYYEFVFNAQGEDVVSGRQRVLHERLGNRLPNLEEQLGAAAAALEAEFRDMQDFEFTVQDGELYFLQTRTGKRTPWAAVQIAADLVRSRVITADEALSRLQAYDRASIHRSRLDAAAGVIPIATAMSASIGAVTGRIVLDPARAASSANSGPVILVRDDLATDDFAGLVHCAGVLTARGGRTSHAAVVARQFGRVCLVACPSLRIETDARRCAIGGRWFAEGALITLDGESGSIYAGAVPMVDERPDDAWRVLDQASLLPIT